MSKTTQLHKWSKLDRRLQQIFQRKHQQIQHDTPKSNAEEESFTKEERLETTPIPTTTRTPANACRPTQPIKNCKSLFSEQLQPFVSF